MPRSDDDAEELRRQSRALAGDPLEREILLWIEEVADTDEWTGNVLPAAALEAHAIPSRRHPREGGDPGLPGELPSGPGSPPSRG
ncbi:antitoxin MazE-like protein [Azospirillum sp. sgz302134]